MDLLQNPFHILGATTRDNRTRLMELADERSLQDNSSECTQARSLLTNPRKRLAAEVAWLPGVSPKYAERVMSALSRPAKSMPPKETLLSLSPMARSNLLASGLQRLTNHSVETVSEWVLELSDAFEEVDPEELCDLINEERMASGFTEVTDISLVESEIKERQRHFRQVIKLALDNLPPRQLVEAVTELVESATDMGEEHCPVLISDLVDVYEVEAQNFLEKEERNIEVMIEKLRAMLDAEESDLRIEPRLEQLAQVVRNWDAIAQPIQVSRKSRGLDHDASHRVAAHIRGLAIHMFNEHGHLEHSQYLTNLLQEVFAEVGRVVELAAEDSDTLGEIAQQRTRLIEAANKREEAWRREITYETDMGIFFTKKLRISPEGIEWKGSRWELDSITRVRWGATRHSVNGIPTRTTYSIFIGNTLTSTTIELTNEDVFSNFVDRLWRAVGVRLMTEYLEGLRDGKEYRFGSAFVSDLGMSLVNKRFFSNNERKFFTWRELSLWNGAGVFCVGKSGDKKFVEAFSYQEMDNIHILEAAISTLRKHGGSRLSDLLGH